MQGNALRKGLLGTGFGILSVIIIYAITKLIFADIFDRFESKLLDWRFEKRIKLKWEARKGAPVDDIVIIEIDDRSLEKLGRFGEWPRTHYAQIVEYVNSGGALAIGFDVLFMERSADKSSDDSLLTALKHAGNVYLAIAFSDANTDAFLNRMLTAPENLDYEQLSYNFVDSLHNPFQTLDRFDGKFIELYNAARGIGFANFFSTKESVIREMPLFINFAQRQYPSLAAAMVMGLLGARSENLVIDPGGSINLHFNIDDSVTQLVDFHTDSEGKLLIDYEGPYRTFRYISFYDVLSERVPAEFFNQKIILVGATAAGLKDWRPVPFQPTFPGVEIHANLIYSMLNQRFIKRSGFWSGLLLSIFLSVAVALFAMALRPFFSVLYSLLLGAGYGFFAIYLFTHFDISVDVLRQLQAMLTAYLIVLIFRFLNEEKDKRIIKNMFNHYLSATVVNELLKNRAQLKPGGKRTVASVLFSDVKSFTSVSENLEPEELVALLNEYLSAMTDVVLKHNGYLDKYEGDAIMAIFGVPLPQTDHALRACSSALLMQSQLAKLRIKWKLENRPLLEMRIGINVGPMIAGNIGGEKRMDYTVIGDSVNLASRLEGANKLYGTSILISEETYERVKDDFIVRELDFIRVKGKKKPVRVYELIARRDEKIDEERQKVFEFFANGLAAYRRGNWELAYNHFQNALRITPDDGPSWEFFTRCKQFMDEKISVSETWDGVYEMMTK
ncbi:adenylate/guanylate cyclase domain-containing protein [candidate division KSB1 bacterium]|nr:adenylate/guanylate cyclase domain-containing protein [candidate division KSB1 bacterium]